MARKKPFVAVITGDVIDSRNADPKQWLTSLKRALSSAGGKPGTWEIYQGDSFQLELSNPARAFLAAIRIKAHLKSIKHLDARMAIGIGEKDFSTSRITESNGEAFVYSGEKFESLKKEKQTLAVKTRWDNFDREMNLFIRFASIAMDNWSTGAADLIKILIQTPDITQIKLAEKLQITQSSVSSRQKRAYYKEIRDLEELFREKIEKMIAQ